MGRSRDSGVRESELKLRLALRASQIGIWDWELATGEMQYSPRARAICGFAPDELITLEKVRAVTHPEDLVWTEPKAKRAFDPKVREKSPYEYRILRADTGEIRWVLAHGEALFSRKEGPLRAARYVGTIQDITERKRAEQALVDSERRLRLAIDAARMAVWEYDIATDSITPSPELNGLFGLPADARPSMEELRALYTEDQRERLRASALEALSRGSNHFEAEFECRWPDGTRHWLLLRAEILAEVPGQYTRLIGVLLDIDERRRSQDRLSILLREVNHRVKNSLSVVQALAAQTFRGGRSSSEALGVFRDRLRSLAAANDTLLREDFEEFPLRELVEEIVAPYDEGDGRVSISGEDVKLPPRLGTPLALVIHELSTNAVKYGALSAREGRVNIEWERRDGALALIWRETDGPSIVQAERKGFGTRLITEILPVEIGDVDLKFGQNGVQCRITMKQV